LIIFLPMLPITIMPLPRHHADAAAAFHYFFPSLRLRHMPLGSLLSVIFLA